MRSDNSNFAELNQEQQREPSFVVEISFDTAHSDLLYLTFDTVSGLSGANVIDGCLEKISGTTQKINPDKANSTIGSLSFSAVDNTLTSTQKTKLAGGDGLRGKRVRYYVGAQSLAWSDFVLAQTQIVESVDYKDNVYTFKCADIQRQMREDIFDPKGTALTASVAKDDTTINVYNTTGFEIVQHPSTVAHEADAPGQEVGYIKIESDGDIEIIRYTGKTSTTFTGCTRGVLGTKPVEIEVPAGTTADNAPKVEEYIYLELPAPMLAYALLTGSIYGETGKYLPDHWHLGISTDYIKTSDFTGIGQDWWDTANADNGVVAVVKGQKKTDGKKFIEEQIYRLLGAFSPVYATGELGLKRLSVVHSTGNYVRVLDEDNIVSYGTLNHDMKAVINRIAISWNWNEVRQAYTRTNVLIDPDSIAAHGEADILKLELRALEGSRHSFTTLKERFDSLRDRYAGPPLRLQLTLTPDQNDLEVGDVVRVVLSHIKDYTGTTGDDTLDRNFEVQQVSTDWVTGDVKVTLFGSSQKAGALTATQAGGEEGTALDTGFYTAAGTEINATNFPGNVSSSAGVTHVTGNITLSGNTDLSNSGAVYYCNEDLTIDTGVTVTITNNVQLRVNGFLQINGDIDGKGQGLSTGDAYFGYSISQPGIAISNVALSASVAFISHRPGTQTDTAIANRVMTVPPFTLSVNGTSVDGIPSDISGTPGEAGRDIYDVNTASAVATGGAGGAGGAGLMVFCEGADFGASGFIDVSGADGSAGGTYANWSRTLHAGKGGGGAPGAVYFVYTLQTPTNIADFTDSTIQAYYGSSDASSYTTLVDVKNDDINDVADLPSGALSFYRRARSATLNREPHPDHTQNLFGAMSDYDIVTGFVDEVEDTPEKADDVVSFTLTEYTNTPPSQQGNISTIEVSVTAPSDPNYSHAWIQYKTALNAPWSDAGPASPEATYQVPSDGTTYYVRALSVSKDNVMSSTGPQDSITVADVVNDPDTEAPTVMTFDSITVACESGGATFTGKDAKFSWTDTNKDKLHFLEYKIEIEDGSSNLMRTERTKDAFYVYTYEKNKEDYEAYHASAGANRSITITVTVVGALDITGGKYEGPTDSLSVSNPAPAAVGSLTVSPGYGVIYVNGTNPTDLDFTRFGIYISQTSGFTAGPSNFLGYANQLPITIASDAAGADLTSGTTYYLRLESYDEFGAGSITTDYSALMAGVPAATEIPVNETLTVDGRIIADASGDPYNVVMGPQTVDSRAALFNFKNTTTGTHYFALFENGDVEINGKVTIGAGSTVPYSYVTSGPPSNADNTATNTAYDTARVNGTLASVIDDGAGRANAGLNASGFVDTAIVGLYLSSGYYSTGLNLNSTHLGYYDGTTWQSYMDSSGNFYLNGDASNYLSWNGTTLTVRGNIQATSVSAGAIDGETITGGTFKTSATGKRVEIRGTDNRILIESGGTEQISLEADATNNELIYVYGTTNYGIFSRADTGVYGYADSGAGHGVYGYQPSGSSGIGNAGVHGYALYGGVGCYGRSTTGYGVRGLATSGYGGYFTNGSSSNPTIYASNTSSGNAITASGATGYGVYATSSGSSKAAVYGVGSSSTAGVAGDSNSGRGLQGKAIGGYGVWGEATSTSVGVGVYGHGGDYGGQFDAPHSGGHGVHATGATYGAWLHGGTFDAFLANTGTAGSFTGAHDALYPKSSTEPVLGDIVVRTGVAYKESVSSTIHYVDRCSSVESKKTYGIISNFVELEDYDSTKDPAIDVASLRSLTETEYETLQGTHKRAIVNGIGEGQINVCDDNGNIEDGDLICTSLTPGKGQLYTGNDSRVIVAQACEGVDWSQETETTKMIACIYMCS